MPMAKMCIAHRAAAHRGKGHRLHVLPSCVIHGDSITPASLVTCARMGFGVDMNPTIKWTVADMMEQFLGPERAAREWIRWRRL